MGDRIEQTVDTRRGPEAGKDTLPLDQVSVSPLPAPDTAKLEEAHFSFAVEKDPLEIEQKVTLDPAAQAAPDTQIEKTAAREPGALLRAESFPSRHLTILDRLMNFLAKLLERLDRAIFRRLRRTSEDAPPDSLPEVPKAQKKRRKAI